MSDANLRLTVADDDLKVVNENFDIFNDVQDLLDRKPRDEEKRVKIVVIDSNQNGTHPQIVVDLTASAIASRWKTALFSYHSTILGSSAEQGD